MRVLLLGTGSADGWPNPFCDCASCAAEREAGCIRRPTSALVDDCVLLDCGPTAPHARGVRLDRVEHLLITHGHHDHLQPSVLLTRSWTAAAAPLHVWGPALAIESCAQWIGPEAPVHLHTVAPGDDLRLETERGEYSARVLRAEHHHGDGDALAVEAVLYVVAAPEGRRLLYATDTGPMPGTTLEAIGGRVDLALVDETFGDYTDHGHGHLDLSTLPAELAALRAHGVVDSRTTVAAVHLSHHNPPTAELRGRLAVLDVVLPDDLDVLDTAVAGAHAPTRTLILGGARSGKSTRAELLASTFGAVDYVATGGDRAGDSEWVERVALHRQRRPSHWATHETAHVSAVLRSVPTGGCVLVDCLTLWLTALLDACDAWTRAEEGDRGGVQTDVDAAVADLVDAVASCPATVVLVSNEVGLGIVPDTASGRLFADLLGRLNAQVADACDDVELMVAGRPLTLRPSHAAGTQDG